MKTRLSIIIGIGCMLIALLGLSIPIFSLDVQFDEIKNDIKKTGYDICDIRLEENKIILDLNWIFEDSDPEKKIISKIPFYFDYEIMYYDGSTDYFIGDETTNTCDYLENLVEYDEN